MGKYVIAHDMGTSSDKAVLVEIVSCDLGYIMSCDDVVLEPRVSQVEVAVFEL